ncbi:MAG TPA: lipopolysaccharide biosynthesis protein [Bacteroidales bacterium]|nr:lipopolysaccharide biosynthesis protein [Bacteroidales bacterium]
MSRNLRQRTITGLFWSFVDNFAVQTIQFIIGVILARLLSPTDFGLIGMITIFISISQWFISSGFGQALIRKQNCTQKDYSTVFIFNIITGVVLYLILFFLAPFISNFFKEPELVLLLKIFGLNLIIISLTIVQKTQLTKRLDFKLQTRISIISSIISGIVGITLALNGFGVWSLVYKSLVEYSLSSGLLWFLNKWRPSVIFSKKSFRELFGFGFKLMLRGLIYTLFNNVYYAVIGKYFSTATLGYYTKAEQFSNLPSSNINKVVNRVTYPSLSELQEDRIELKKVYKKMFTTLVFITSALMILLCALAEPVIITLIGEKWRPSIIILQLLSVVGLLYPLCDFNLTVLKIVGNSSLILKLEIIKRILSIPIIVLGVKFGLNYLLLGIIILSTIEFMVNGYFSGKHISYSLREQIEDIIPNIILSLIVGIVVFIFSKYSGWSSIANLFSSLLIAFILIIGLSELFRNKAYLSLKQILLVDILRWKFHEE